MRTNRTLSQSFSDRSLLEVHELKKTYYHRRRATDAVKDVSFKVERGEVVGLLGANGAGKTTTIKCICTLVRPTSGVIQIDGVDVVRHPRKGVSKLAALLEGNRNIYWRLTVKENLELFAAFQGMSRRESASHVGELIELFNLQDKRDAPARFLSKGMQQKLAIACAIVRSTPLLLLDEPTLGLDVETTHELRGYVKGLSMGGRTMLLSSHDMNLIEALCDRVILINGGRVVTDDSVANLLNLFKSRAYRFTIAGSLHADQLARLEDRFPQLEVSQQVESTLIDVQLPAAPDIYELIHVLEAEDAIIESIDRRDPNFEQVFLRMIEESSLEHSGGSQ